MNSLVKEEIFEEESRPEPVVMSATPEPPAVVELSSSDDDDDDDDVEEEACKKKFGDLGGISEEGGPRKRRKSDDGAAIALPLGFLDPLPPSPPPPPPPISEVRPLIQSCRQFWKAGDYEGDEVVDSSSFSAGMDHMRVHPKFLHSNATSHKWALGAFAELLDNSVDEVCHGATFVNIDMLENKKDGTKMLLIEDNGGGMDPDKVRQCMSLGYSTKSKLANTIGQYGNGFKTSTMRLGADVIVFSRCPGKGGKGLTQSIGMLSYTFLRSTGKEDIIVPMLDYENRGQNWDRLMRTSPVDWSKNLEMIIEWSPYLSEVDLLQQFSSMSGQGTRIIIYNIWEDDQGELELDFGTDKHDIQIRGVNRDEKKIQMAERFPNSKHFLTYRHSLRSYASILYLRLPQDFKMILRGKDIVHHNIVNDMMLKQEVTYKPQPGSEGILKATNMIAVVMIGFVKDAKDHIDVQGFNVYHKNRLIKPFWRVWNAAGSDGRGVIGVLEANFVEPAHDKQGFERTTVLSRLEARLVQMQKQYWRTNCHKVGYAPRQKEKDLSDSSDKESSPKGVSSRQSRKGASSMSAPAVTKVHGSARLQNTGKSKSHSKPMSVGKNKCLPVAPVKVERWNGHLSAGMETRKRVAEILGDKTAAPHLRPYRQARAGDENEIECAPLVRLINGSGGSRALSSEKSFQKDGNYSSLSSSPHMENNGMENHHASNGGASRILTRNHSKEASAIGNGTEPCHPDSDVVLIKRLEDENRALKDRIKEIDSMSRELEYERERNNSLIEKLEATEKKLEEANKEQEALIDIFSEERGRRDQEEENLRKKLKDASVTIQDLLEKLSSRRTSC